MNDRIVRIAQGYTDGRIFAIDLVGAVRYGFLFFLVKPPLMFDKVIRQGSFVKKMTDLGWTEPSFFVAEEDQVVLQLAVARYHAYVQAGLSFRTVPSRLMGQPQVSLI
jgi:hypothetical protein